MECHTTKGLLQATYEATSQNPSRPLLESSSTTPVIPPLPLPIPLPYASERGAACTVEAVGSRNTSRAYLWHVASGT